MNNFLDLPENLPVPQDDGAARHLNGAKLISIPLHATDNSLIDLSKMSGTTVVFIYPMSGVPGVELPAGWDDIPGARGCTPQACSYRDKYSEVKKYVDNLFGLSVQNTAYQRELKLRVGLPYEILSDSDLIFAGALKLPTFEVHGMLLLKRLTLIIINGVIVNHHYPVFPSERDVDWVLNYFASKE